MALGVRRGDYRAKLRPRPDGAQECKILSKAEMIPVFSLDKLGASAAVFDEDKLKWVNGKYLSTLPVRDVLHHLRPFLEQAGIGEVDEALLERAVDLHRTRPRTLADLAAGVKPYFVDGLEYDSELCAQFREQPELPGLLGALKGRFAQAATWEAEALEEGLRNLAAEKDVKAGALIHPTRMALTAAKAGPSLFEVVEVMGKEGTFRHLNGFVAYLRASSAA